MPRRNRNNERQPVAVLGAGDLISHVHRRTDAQGLEKYGFSLFRMNEEMRTTHELRACDLPDLVKLCQVLAFAIEDDGWLAMDEREELRGLFADLDEVTRRWSSPHHA